MRMGHWWNDNDQGKLKHLGKEPVVGSLSTISHMWPGLGLNQDFCGERLVTDCVSDCMVAQWNFKLLSSCQGILLFSDL